MSTYTPSIHEWTRTLRNLPPGISVADLFLANSYSVVRVEPQPVQSEIGFVIDFTGGYPHPHPLFDATASGLETPASKTVKQIDDTIELDRIPRLLREMSGLPVKMLASLAHVSRNAYNKWLAGKGVSDEHAKRLFALLDVLQILRDLRGSALKDFLEEPGPAGRPIDLLATDKYDFVIGLALRPPSAIVDADSISQAARDISGLPGWTRPAARLNWDAPRLSAAELDRALDRLSPRPLMNQGELSEDADENDDAFVAWGFVWE